MRTPIPGRRTAGFTLIELTVVLALLAVLVTIAVPSYFHIIDKGRVAVQVKSLAVMRESIDRFHGDRGRWPDSLEELVQTRYLRAVPVDPVTERADWVVVPPQGGATGVWDVRSAAESADAVQRLADARAAAAGAEPAQASDAAGGAVSRPGDAR
jgi:general secretion pathway protein G